MLITIVTDYLMHSFWVDKAIDYYCVAQDASKEHLIKRGIYIDYAIGYGTEGIDSLVANIDTFILMNIFSF